MTLVRPRAQGQWRSGELSSAADPIKETPMAVLRIVQPEMVTKERYDEVNAHLGVESDPPPAC